MTTTLPHDHDVCLDRARLSLDGLSVGDAFGGQFFRPGVFGFCYSSRTAPPGPWRYTDDTAMALGLFEVIEQGGHVEQDILAETFARVYAADPTRGYGATAHDVLHAIHAGRPWRSIASAVFDGEGSMGNGSAMRIGPLGAYFADDLDRVVSEAQFSAEVTHAHPEGIAGAIAIAIGAATAWNLRGQPAEARLLAAAWERMPPGATRDRVEYVRSLAPETPADEIGRLVGNGSQVTCPDTVPFALWVADRYAEDYPAALWATVSAGGDVDTTCAIVGGMVALSAQTNGIPAAWLAEREVLK